MSDAHAPRPYIKVWVWLATLTAVEVAVVYTGMYRILLVVILLTLAFAKASMVALYYMHLKWDRRLLHWIAISPVPLGLILILAGVADHKFAMFHTLAGVANQYLAMLR